MNDNIQLFELATLQGFGHAAGLGFILAFLFVILSLLSWVWTYAWAWIDETSPKAGPMSLLLCKIYKAKLTSMDAPYVTTGLIMLCTPSVMWLVCTFFTFTLVCVVVLALAHLTRYVRRLHKGFVKHTEDKEAHK